MSEETLEDVISGEQKEPETKEPEVKEPETTADVKEPEQVKEPDPVAESSSVDIVKELMGKQDAIMAELGRVREQNRKLKAEEPEKKEPTNIWEDPEKRLDELGKEFDSKLTKTRRSLSESYARKAFKDYDQKLDVFLGMVETKPWLVAEMDAADDPATFAYETAASKMILDKVGNVSDFEGGLRKQIEAEVEAKYKRAEAERLGEALPDSLADKRAAADNTSFVEDTLEDVVGIDARHK